MPLIQTKAASAAASIVDRVITISEFYNASIHHLNGIVSDVIALDDTDLAEFANTQGPIGLNELTTLHKNHGEAINALAETASHMLSESGVSWDNAVTDVRPLNEKLADQGRELVYQDGLFSVIKIEPEVIIVNEPAPEN